jgi:predicted GH43/DUF377 family glycosyl hydrolase
MKEFGGQAFLPAAALRGGALWDRPSACPRRLKAGGSLKGCPPSMLLLLALCGCGRYDDFTLPGAGHAQRVTFTWKAEPAPVLGPGEPGAWDAVDVLNPSIVQHDRVYYNFYSGFDGKTWHTGLATSPDGIAWTRAGKVLSPDPATWEGDYIAANGSALRVGSEFLYWYQAGRPPRIGLSRSANARNWAKSPAPVLDLGPRGSWDERGVADPYVIRLEDEFYMYYLGQDRARRQRLGVAWSDDGVHWTKLRSNPILELGPMGAFDEEGLGEPAVWASHGSYWMLYTGRDRAENRRLGLAQSDDGVHWRRMPAVFTGDQAWDSKVVCDPHVEAQAGRIRVWFGGGDVASPDERLHGRIGVATLTPAQIQ